MAERTDPPKKRYRLQLSLDAHDLEHALSLLELLVNDAAVDGLPAEVTSGAGYHLTWTDRNPTMTAQRYEEELMAWFNERGD